MAGELKRPSVGTGLSQAEWESATGIILDSGVVGDIVYWDGVSMVRLAAPAVGLALMGNGAGLAPSYQSIASPNRPVTVVTFAMSPYTVLPGDDILLVDSSGGAVTLDLPTAIGILGQTYTIKKTSSDVNVVTVDPSGAQTIDGQANMTIDMQYTSFDIVSNNANWDVI